MKIYRTLVHLLLLSCALLQPAVITAQSTHPSTDHPSTDIDRSIASNIGDPAAFHKVFTALQQAVARHDAASVASLVSYPLAVDPHTSRAQTVRTPKDFVERYDRIMTPHIAEVITKQKYEDLFVNYQGAMFGQGEVWISGICQDNACKTIDIRVKTIQSTTGK